MNDVVSILYGLASNERAASTKRFFKINPGGYAEKDIFIGVKVPDIKMLARKVFKHSSMEEIYCLLSSKIHEERHLALFILAEKFQRAKNKEEAEEVFNFYIQPRVLERINNWDLVDCSCYKIVGQFLLTNTQKSPMLYHFAESEKVWIRRIAIVSTLTFIKNRIFCHTLKISKDLLTDKEDLIQKAVGWMLREVGNVDKDVLVSFLNENASKMPSTMFRYATEKLNPDTKNNYVGLRASNKNYIKVLTGS